MYENAHHLYLFIIFYWLLSLDSIREPRKTRIKVLATLGGKVAEIPQCNS
jgi:hypothetical protein